MDEELSPVVETEMHQRHKTLVYEGQYFLVQRDAKNQNTIVDWVSTHPPFQMKVLAQDIFRRNKLQTFSSV